MGYAAEYFTGERCDGLSIIGLLCIIPFPIAEEVGFQSWSWRMEGRFFIKFLTQRRRVAEYAEEFIAACGRGIGVGRSFIKVFIAEASRTRASRSGDTR